MHPDLDSCDTLHLSQNILGAQLTLRLLAQGKNDEREGERENP